MTDCAPPHSPNLIGKTIENWTSVWTIDNMIGYCARGLVALPWALLVRLLLV